MSKQVHDPVAQRRAADVTDGGKIPSQAHNPWMEAEAQLDEVVAEAVASARASHREWRDSIDDLFHQWNEFLADLASRHAGFAEQLAATRPEDNALPRQVLADYRRAVTREVLQPLLDVVSKNCPPIDVADRFMKLLDATSSLAERFPESVQLLEPRELYEKGLADSGTVRIRKSLHRLRLAHADVAHGVRSGFNRLLRRETDPRPPSSRLVPARQLAAFCFRQRLPDTLIDEYTRSQHDLALIAENVERLVRAWANAVLIIAREADPDRDGSGLAVNWAILSDRSATPGRDAARQKTEKVDLTTADDVDEAGEGDGAQAESGDESDTPSLFDDLYGRALEFQTGLSELVSQAEAPAWEEEDVLAGVFDQLRKDLNEGGTLLLTVSTRAVPEVPASLNVVRESIPRWKKWYVQFDERIRYYLHLMKLREKLLSLEQALLKRVLRATVDPVLTTFSDMSDRLAKGQQEVLDSSEKARQQEDTDVLADGVERVREQLVSFVQKVFSHLPGLVSSDQVLSDPGRKEWDDLSRFVQSLPESISMHSLQSDRSAVDHRRLVEIDVRDPVAEVLEPPLPDRLRRSAEQLRAAVRRVWTETEQVQHIVQYNLDAAIDELASDDEDGDAGALDRDPETEAAPREPAVRIQSAEDLVVDGLDRAAMTLSQLSLTLRPAWDKFVETVHSEFRQDWTDVHRRLHSSDTAEEQWAGLWSQFGRRMEKTREAGRKQGQKLWTLIARATRVGRRRAESLIRIGQTAVGVLDTAEVSRYEAIDALVGVGALQTELPLIYRRLFSFDPLDETSLLEGRARDIVWIRQHFGRWRDAHQVGVLIVQAPVGSGRTSMLNALAETVFSDCDVCQINLKERLYNSDEFAALIGSELGIRDADITIDELERMLAAKKRAEKPKILLIDNLEHLVLRAAQSVNTLERVILFMSRTDRSIYWIGTVGTYTWQFLSKTAGTAVGFVDSYQLTPLDRSTLESLIINRHRRSGMALQFVEPDDASAILRQRLRRAKSDEQRQALSREEYFDRLWRSSGQNVMLALYYWIRSANFSEDQTTLSVKPLKPLPFGYLGDLPLEQAFTLKAFFLHKTLSLSDHSRIFNMDNDDSTAILESLLNQYIIEEVPLAERHPAEDYHVKRDAIYRMRPLLIHPVTSFLQSKNIVY